MNRTDVLVSVIIPVYNVEDYLCKCVDSAINQTLKEIEIVLVDDGSTDSSGLLCDKYSEKDKRVKVIHKENGGLSDARNAGYAVSRGEFIYFLDADDWIESYALESLYSFAKEKDLEMVLFDSRVVDENDTDFLDKQHYMRYYRIGEYDGVTTGPELFSKMINAKEHFSCVPLLFIRRDRFTVRFEKMLHEDELFTICMLYKLTRVAYYPEALYVRRIRRDSIMTVKKTPMHYYGMLEVIEGLLRLKNIDTAVLRYVCTLLQCTEMIYKQLEVGDRNKVKQKRKAIIKKIKSNCFGYKRLALICRFLPLYPLYDKIMNSEQSILRRLFNRFQRYRQEKLLIKSLSAPVESKIVVLGVPTHGNLGDHAISIAQRSMLNRLLPNKTIIEIDTPSYMHHKRRVARLIHKKDILVIPGGGWLGNQWYHNEIMVEGVCKRFCNNKIIIMPQTVYFENTKEKDAQIAKAKRVFSNNQNLLFFVRDKNSLDFTKENFGIDCFLAPDVVLRLTKQLNLPRSGILFCFREDCERVFGSVQQKELIDWAKEVFGSTKNTTTVIGNVEMSKRITALDKKLREFSRAELVITDRLHAMIFAAITGTPCIAFDNSSKKVSGVYEWISKLGYVKTVSNVEEAKTETLELINKRNNAYLPPDFSEMEERIKAFVYN